MGQDNRRPGSGLLSPPSGSRSELKYTWPQPQLGRRPGKPKARAPSGWPVLETLVRHFLPKDMSVWKQQRGTRALRVCEAEACPYHEQNSKGNGNTSRLDRSAAAPVRYPAIRGVSGTASSDPNCALRPTLSSGWLLQLSSFARGSVFDQLLRAGSRPCPLVSADQGECRMPEPIQTKKTIAEGIMRSVPPAASATLWQMWKFRCWLWVKSVTSLDVCPSFVSTTRSQWSCASLRLCSSRACAFSCFFDWVLAIVFQESNGRVESNEGSCTMLKPSTCRLDGCRGFV